MTAEPTRSDRYIRVEEKLGEPLGPWLIRNHTGTWSDLMYEIRTRTDISLAVETVRLWTLAAQEAAEAEAPASPPRRGRGRGAAA